MDQDIKEAKTSISELGKIIKGMSVTVDSEGKKLARLDKVDKEHPTVEMGTIKINSMNVQKDFEKHEEQLKKLDLKAEDLTKKVGELDGRIGSHICTSGVRSKILVS